ncbi:MAG: SAM-dependent methyltransferase, partial [Crocinitomicaceae bacterium]|nr:SAM-dependent methyltransferase [Crocinitomicaceae bacterium]
ANALEKAKIRLGEKAAQIEWIVSDINDFVPTKQYAIWHDRAVFHFLTENNEIQNYTELVSKNTTSHFIIGTFSENGPLKCSGLEIKQYTVEQLNQLFGHSFKLISSFKEDHTTPFNTIQNFTFASFKRSYSDC